jgi:hypothetical protein
MHVTTVFISILTISRPRRLRPLPRLVLHEFRERKSLLYRAPAGSKRPLHVSTGCGSWGGPALPRPVAGLGTHRNRIPSFVQLCLPIREHGGDPRSIGGSLEREAGGIQLQIRARQPPGPWGTTPLRR